MTSALDEAFPQVPFHRNPGKSTNYIVQLRSAKRVSKGGIVFTELDRDAESANTTIGKVVAIGSGCFKHGDGRQWPEGPWFELGEYLQVPMYGGMRFRVKHGNEYVNFVMFDHLQFLAKVMGDPLEIVDYV